LFFFGREVSLDERQRFFQAVVTRLLAGPHIFDDVN
jgi:hypothetical protein